jgi:hypothetical protein
MTSLIDDETATRFYNEIDNAPEEDRQQMADALLAWGEEKQSREREETDTHFSKLFTDDAYFQQINDNDPALSEALDPEATAKRASIHAYLEHQLNRPIDAANFEPERDAFAMQAFGQKNLNDGQLFDFIRGDYDWQKQRTEAINDLQMQSVGKAIADSQLGQTRPFVDGMTEVFNQWQQKYPELVDGKNDAAFLSQGYKLYYDTINDLDTVRPQASKALSTLTSFTQGNATDEDMQSLANDFVGAPPEDRQKIYKYVTLAAQAGQIDRAGIEQFAINMGQAFTRGFDFVPQGTLQMQEAGVNNWLESIRNGTQIWVPMDGDLTKAVVGNAPAGAESDAWRQATVPEAETLIQSGHNVRESFKVVRELRNVAKTGVDPIRPVLEEKSFWGTAERGAYGLSGSIPLMGATAVNPYLGVLAYQATEYDRIMLENPEINPQFAQGLALVEGAANAAIDRVQLSSLSGRLPMFGRYLDRIASNGVRRTVKIGANVVEQNLQEGAQDLIAPVLETAVAALREDMPDKDFGKLLNEWGGQRAETFFATLPLALIGGGVATYRDIKNPSAELNATKLRMAGFGKDQVTFIQRAENPEEYDARIQMEWEKRTSENIKAGEQEVLNTIEKARTPGELDARIERVTAPDGSEDIVVTSPDGRELLRTKSEQAALEAVRQHNEAQLINERNAVSDMVDYFRAQDPTNEATIEAPRTVQQELDRLTEAGDSKGIANLNERIRFAGIPEGSDLTTYNILGEANVETTAEGVFRGVIKLRENSRPEDAFEEINHVFVRKALAEGRTDLDSLRGWLNQTSEATGETYATDTETDIIENIAKVGMDYAAGRIEETSLPASFVDYIKRMLQVFKETMARAIKLKDAFATGKIDSNFEAFLAESVGLNQQTMVETTRERAGGELAQGTFNYSVGQRVSTDTNPYPMEQKGKWWANEDFAQRGGQIVTMSPDEFLSQVRPLEVDEASRDNIDDLKNMMQSGRKLDPLAIYADGKEDGRHRATAAKELGMDTIPVLDFRPNKPEPKGNDFSIGSRASAVSTDTPSIRASNATITGPANYSIAAHHGTPHKVDKFSTAKIGTGEGAQAYGWGLYFAQNKGVAEDYQDRLTNDSLILDGVSAMQKRTETGNQIWGHASQYFADGARTKKQLLAKLQSARDFEKARGNKYFSDEKYAEVENAISQTNEIAKGNKGNLYTVELDAEPEDLLDWDKPLSDQSPKVKALLANYRPSSIPEGRSLESMNGKFLYRMAVGDFADSSDSVAAAKSASEFFKSIGIPGIRYADEGSRDNLVVYETGNASGDWLVWRKGLVSGDAGRILSTHSNEADAKAGLEKARTYNYVVFDENLIKITEENGNRIPASQALAQPVSADTNYSIGMTVAPLRRDSLSELNKKEMQKRASSAKFIHLQQVIDDVAKAYGVKIESRQPVIGGWVESGQISLEVPEAILFDTDDLEMAQEMAAIVGASAPELQNAVMLWKDDDAGKDTVLEFQAKGADSALAVAKDLNAAGLNGFTYDTKSRKFSLVLAGVADEDISKVNDFITRHTEQGSISSRGGTQARAGSARFPSESDYRGYLQGARSRADLLQQGQREALLDVVDRAERRVDRYAAALKISEQAKKIQKKLKRPSTSALAIETELKGKQFDNIRQLGLYLDARFNKVFGKPSFEIGGQEGIDIASDAFVYDIIDGLAGDGSGMGWYDERVQETIRELSKLHPEFATDSNALAVYIGILATTSQGYTVVENFKQANKVYNEYKRTGRIPTDFKFAKSSDPINSNLAQIQGLIDEHGLDGYAEFMDQEVTGQALRDQFGKTPTGVTLKDTVRGNRVLGPKIGSFFNNLRGQFDTITMDLWYTRTMHRFLGETVVPLDSDKMQKAITKFREELKKDGVRTYGIDFTEAIKDDEATVQAALTLFQRWARGDNDYTEKGYFKFPDGYKIEKAARGIFSIGGMKGAPQNKTHRQYFAKVVLEAKAKLAKLGMKLTEADMQAIIWYREKNLFARTGVANAAAKPADYLDAVMVARSGAQAQEDVDPADLEAEDGDTNYSIASQSEIDRVNRALGGMNRGPDERLKVYERAKQKFSKLMSWNSDELAAMADTGSDETQIRRNQLLQGFGELDAILQVLPPEVRGRVGGYTVLANIAPMDVFKDGVKVSEAKNMDGAIISAWMKEGQNIGQAGKQVSLPPGYTAKENLASKRADKALADFFRDRIKKIDTELEKVLVREYTEAITKAVKQSRPKAGDNNVRKSTLGAETQKFADMVYRATLLDDEATPKRMAEIEAALANPDATAEDISALSEEWSILNTFGDLDNRSSETLAQGLDWLKGQLQMGREAWRIKEQARIDEQRARAAATIEWLGKGTAKKRNATKTTSQLASDLANHYLLSHASFEQFVTAIFPPEIAATWSDRLRKADEASQAAEIRDRRGILDAVREGAKAANMSAGDAMLWLKGDQKNAVAYLEDRQVKDERIAIDLAQKIVTGEADRSKLNDADIETLRNELAALPADTQKEYVTIKRVIFRGKDVKLDMSRGKAIQYLLSWNQPDVQIKMRKEGWTDESAADLKALVNDPVSRSVINYLQSLYGKGAGIVNPVYSRMFGMTMPQVKNYAPTRFLNANDSKDIGLDGSHTATGTTPGFAKSRVTHSAKIAPEDALTVAQGHIAQQAHWVHFAELAREFRAILSNPEVRESIKQTHGESVLKDAELWADQLEQRGGNKARESTWMTTILGTVLSGKAVSSLGFSLKTLAMQLDSTIRFGLALDMRQIVSALSNPSTIVEDIQTVWESDAIQNRLQGGATAEARFLFSRYAGKPNFGAKIAEASMTPINWLDSAATSISSAIVYRANLNDALAAGMPENLAKQAALDAASQAIYRFAQPVSFGQKSIMENNGNVLAKTFFLFMSDPRLKTAILADAARGLATGQGNANEHIRRILVVETMAVLSHVVASAFRDVFSDDDDEEIWNLGGFAKAILLAPLQGFFFAGTVGELAISKLTGQKTFNSSTQNPLLSAMEQAVRAGNNLDDVFNLDDPDAMLKEWNNIFRSMALAPWLAAPAVLLNMVKPVYGLYQNATTEE